jgi:hypothetical protein
MEQLRHNYRPLLSRTRARDSSQRVQTSTIEVEMSPMTMPLRRKAMQERCLCRQRLPRLSSGSLAHPATQRHHDKSRKLQIVEALHATSLKRTKLPGLGASVGDPRVAVACPTCRTCRRQRNHLLFGPSSAMEPQIKGGVVARNLAVSERTPPSPSNAAIASSTSSLDAAPRIRTA